MTQSPHRCEFRGFTWDLMIPSNIDTEIQHGRDWEPVLTKYIEAYVGPGMNVVDVGANIGWFTLIMGKLVGESGSVFAYEPEPSFYDRLLKHWELNADKVTGHTYLSSYALSNCKDRRWIVKNVGPYFGSAVIRDAKPAEEYGGVTEVECVLFDDVSDGRPLHFMKIDTDGHELRVLQGAAKTIQRDRPRMIVELLKNGEAPLVAQLLCSWGYNILREHKPQTTFQPAQTMAQFGHGQGRINIFAEPR